MAGGQVVLVHGAWGCPAMWDQVVDALDGRVDDVAVADLPSASRSDGTLADDVEHVRSLVAADGPVVLCGHSYGGVVITEAGADADGVVGLVYVAAFAPDAGESAFDWLSKRPIEGDPLIFDDDGTMIPSTWAVDDGSYTADVLERMQQLSLRPHTVGSTITPVAAVAWRELPSTYLLALGDQTLHPDSQREMAERAGSTIVPVEVGHMLNMAAPEAVADAIVAQLGSAT